MGKRSQLRMRANAVLDPMDFGLFYDEPVGQLFGGAWTDLAPDGRGAKEGLLFTRHHYGTLNTEPRIASYIGIARGQLSREHYFRLFRTLEPIEPREPQITDVFRIYLGVNVFEDTRAYAGGRLVPTWGGSMFEALMVPLVVPEELWGAKSWGLNHSLYVRAQKYYGLGETGHGFWGFSPSADPAGGYREHGVKAIGLNLDNPTVEIYGQNTVTPYASFLALRYDEAGALANLEKLTANFDAYGQFGFYDAINVATGDVARSYLALDQGMILAALTNALTDDSLRKWFCHGEVRAVIRPLLRIETFESRGEE